MANQNNASAHINGVDGTSQTSITATAGSSAQAATLSQQTQSGNSSTVSWLQESWQYPQNTYERLVMGVPRLGLSVLTQNLQQRYLDLAPEHWRAADFTPVRDANGGFLGIRRKLPTWPLTKMDLMKAKSW
jgi:hypothetical protein